MKHTTLTLHRVCNERRPARASRRSCKLSASVLMPVSFIVNPVLCWQRSKQAHSDLERLHQFAVFFAYFHHFRYLKVVQLLQNCAKTFHFDTVLGRQKIFEDRPSRLNLAFIALKWCLEHIFRFFKNSRRCLLFLTSKKIAFQIALKKCMEVRPQMALFPLVPTLTS